MKKTAFILSALVATSFSVETATAEQRKSLFTIWKEKADERKAKRRAERLRRLQAQSGALATPAKISAPKKYTYRVAKKAPIKIVAKPVEFASLEEPTSDEIEVTLMTADLVKVENFKYSTEFFIAEAISDYYSETQTYRWISENGEWNSRARSVIKLFETADEYGLRSKDYLRLLATIDHSEDYSVENKRLKAEIAMTTAALRYAMDAKFGTVNPNRLSGYHDFPNRQKQSLEVLENILSPALPLRTLTSMHPSNTKFMALKEELAALSGEEDDIIELPTKILIKPGQSNEELSKFIAAIQKRGSKELLETHSEFLNTYQGDVVYSDAAVALVKAYQKEAGLGADGIIGRNTATSLAGMKSANKQDKVRLAMERLRWLPHEFGERHVFINQPEYRARYIEGETEKLNMRVVVGKKSNQTNFFYDEIEHVVYNPYWGVPQSIIVNKFAAQSISNPSYLDQLGYEVTYKGQRVAASSINWSTVSKGSGVGVRQPPGAKNALGNLKIMFPNKHSIYMHDTPQKHLFKKQHRAFSHGCVRLHDPQAMAAAVLGKSKEAVWDRIKNGGRDKTQKLSVKVPVYVSYFTAWPQQDGSIGYFSDMYGRDAHLMKAMEMTDKARNSTL